jgi:hypothetical protein
MKYLKGKTIDQNSKTTVYSNKFLLNKKRLKSLERRAKPRFDKLYRRNAKNTNNRNVT